MRNRDKICVGVRSSGFPKNQSHQIINLIQMWLRDSGPEWTVERLKSLKTWYIQRLSGVKPERPDWVKFNKRDLPSGTLSLIFRCKKPQKVISALMAYSGITLRSVSKKQWEKFYSSLSKEPDHSYPNWITDGWAVRWRFVCPSSRVNEIGWDDMPYTDEKTSSFDHIKVSDLAGRQIRVPSYDNNCSSSVDMCPEEIIKGVNHPLARWYLRWTMAFAPNHILNLQIACDPRFMDGDESKTHVGRIGFIQEPGCKLRAVANPLPIFQILLSRLGQELYSRLHRIPQDCTFDQEKGLNLISDQLSRGNKLHSLDLSDATNNFPLGLTIAFLANQVSYADAHIDWALFAKLSRASWSAPPNPDGRGEVHWTVGQPLGLYPSFAAFALSHHCVVRDVIYREGLSNDDAFYVILGDDIVCSDKLGRHLRDAYQALTVPISESKSVSSATLAEFAGRLVLKKENSDTQVLVQPKYRTISDRSFISLRRNLGRQVTQFFRPRQIKVINFLENILPEHHPCGLKSWRNLKNSGEYLISSRLAEAISSDNLVVRQSPLSEDLKDVKDMIYVDHARKVSGLRQLPSSNQSESGTSEERLLEKIGITKADFPEDAPSSWSCDQDIGGDPRGPSSLEVMEYKIQHEEVQEILNDIDDLNEQFKSLFSGDTSANTATQEPVDRTHVSHQDDDLDDDDDRDAEEGFFRYRT